MRLHDRMPIVALCVIVLLIMFAGPLVGVVHTLHLDPNVVAIGLGVVITACVALVIFRRPLARLIQGMRERIGQMEDGNDEYQQLLLTSGQGTVPLLDDQGYDQEETQNAGFQDDETCLLLAPNCPLPLSSAYNPTLILEQPGSSRRGRSVAARLYAEQFSGCDVPQIILTLDAGYTSLVPYMFNGYLAGSPQASQERISVLKQYESMVADITEHYVPITEQNARAFAKRVIETRAQVVVDLSSYGDPAQAALVFTRILAGIQESEDGCVLMILQADRWLPNDRWVRVPGQSVVDDPTTINHIRTIVHQFLNSEHIAVILATDTLVTMDFRLTRQCCLWLLNMQPEAEDQPFICASTGLTLAGLSVLETQSILADLTTQSVMTLELRKQHSPHTEPGSRQPSGLLLSDFAGADLDQELYQGK